MKVTAILFNPPGRGESIKTSLSMSDEDFPSDAFTAGQRSVNAMKHFYPGPLLPGWMSLPFGRALVCVVEDGRMVVRGSHWEVHWETDAYERERTEFFARFMRGEASNEDLIARIEATPTAMVCDLTVNNRQQQGVPA